jgi:hypothetical protein
MLSILGQKLLLDMLLRNVVDITMKSLCTIKNANKKFKNQPIKNQTKPKNKTKQTKRSVVEYYLS